MTPSATVRLALRTALRTGPALLPLLAASVAAAGPTPSRPDPLASRSEDDATRALKRIFQLEGGATVRAIGRQVDGAWEVKQNGRWTAARWPIVRVRLEREVLAEMRAMAAKLPDDAPAVQRCELADWMLRNGLLGEGLAELDRIVSEADHACASATLERHAFRFALPDAWSDAAPDDLRARMEPVFQYASRATPALRELCIQKLEAHGSGPELRTLLAEDAVSSSPGRRIWSAFALGRIFPGEEVDVLLGRAVLDASEDVREVAQAALRDAHEPGLVIPVLRALEGSGNPRVRVNAAQALGGMGYPAAVPGMIARLATLEGGGAPRVPHANIFVGRQFAYLQDFDVEVAQGQAVADPQVNVGIEGQVTDAGVVGIKRVEFTVERQTLRHSLERLTGARAGRTSEDWQAWFEEHGQDLLAPASRE